MLYIVQPVRVKMVYWTDSLSFIEKHVILGSKSVFYYGTILYCTVQPVVLYCAIIDSPYYTGQPVRVIYCATSHGSTVQSVFALQCNQSLFYGATSLCSMVQPVSVLRCTLSLFYSATNLCSMVQPVSVPRCKQSLLYGVTSLCSTV